MVHLQTQLVDWIRKMAYLPGEESPHIVSTPNGIRRTPDKWCSILGVQVLDPDGWDRRNFEEDWARPLTLDEFIAKAQVSTISVTKPEYFLEVQKRI